jgi:excisionase family DNA binding protein
VSDQIAAPQLLLTMKQAALALQISERSLWELLRRGEIPRIKIGASVRIDIRDLEAWIAGKKCGVA